MAHIPAPRWRGYVMRPQHHPQTSPPNTRIMAATKAVKGKGTAAKETLEQVTLAGRAFRSRTPNEWSADEADRALEYGFAMRDVIKGADESGDITDKLYELAGVFVRNRTYRDALAIGLWPLDTAFPKESGADERQRVCDEVRAFFHENNFLAAEVLNGTVKALNSFFSSARN
jgi:hypothetical protein